jgi:hypothetical protein
VRSHIKFKLNQTEKQRLRESIETGSLTKGKIFYEEMQTALRQGTIDENDIVHFVEICYCMYNINRPDKRADFLFCRSCFWCASHFNFIESSITKCPICHNNYMEQLPVSIRPELQITPLSK